MINKLPPIKIITGLFVLVLLLVISLLIILKFNLKKIETSDKLKNDKVEQEVTGKNETFEIGVDKKTNLSTNTSYYFLEVFLDEVPLINQETGNLEGIFFFRNDLGKNLLKFSMKNTLNGLYVGRYHQGFDQGSTWKYEQLRDVSSLLKKGNQIQLIGIFEIESQAGREYVEQLDNVFNKIEKADGSKIVIPDNFIFKAYSIGVLDK